MLDSSLLFLYLHKCSYGKRDETKRHDEQEEVLVADVFGYETRNDAREHYATEVLTCGADGKDGGGAFTARECDEEEGVGCITKPVAYLFYADAGGCEPQIGGGEETEVYIDDIGQGDAQH